MMMSALKMTAERMALNGDARPHDVERRNLREHRHEQRREDGEVLGHVVGDGERGERAARHEQLLADLDHLEELGGVGVEVDHVAGFLRRLGAGVHGHADVGLGERGRVVGAVAGHGHELALRLLVLDEAHLRLGRRLGEEVVDAGLAGDGRGGARVVAGDHDRADAHGAEAVEALLDAALHDVLEVNDAEHARAVGDRERRAAGVADPRSGLARARPGRAAERLRRASRWRPPRPCGCCRRRRGRSRSCASAR